MSSDYVDTHNMIFEPGGGAEIKLMIPGGGWLAEVDDLDKPEKAAYVPVLMWVVYDGCRIAPVSVNPDGEAFIVTGAGNFRRLIAPAYSVHPANNYPDVMSLFGFGGRR